VAARVLYRDSQGRDGSVELNAATPCYVGRALDCAIRTDDAMVSRRHSLIRLEQGRFYVEDLGSSNGTRVNDLRVSKHPLSHNDVVRCGSLWLRFVEDGPIAAPLAAPVAPARPEPDWSPPPPLGSPAAPGYGFGTTQEAAHSAHGHPVQGLAPGPARARRDADVGAADDLREELRRCRDELAALRRQSGEAGAQLAERDRQLARARDEIARLGAELADQAGALAAARQAQADGWRKYGELEAQLAELRRLTQEQEVLLGERQRVLAQQEQIVKELRDKGAVGEGTIDDDVKTTARGAPSEPIDLAVQLERAEQRGRDLEAELVALRALAAGGKKPLTYDDTTAVVDASANPAAIKDRAIAVHDDISDVLSAMKQNLEIVRAELARVGEAGSVAELRTMGDAIEALATAEEAKKVLRGLRELVSFQG
jgi:FHA domain-containing protein